MADTHESKCARSNRALIGEALADLVAAAKGGGPRTRIGLMVAGGEVPAEEYLRGASLAMRRDPRIQAVGLGPKPDGLLPDDMDWIETPACEADMAAAMEKALESTGPGALQGAVALHYPFPVGVATLGRIQTPARGRPMILASSTGVSAPHRACAMLRNALYGIATAKALGVDNPSLGVLNLEAAPQVMRALTRLRERGYPVRFGESVRKDGGTLLRGNDLLAGATDVCVCDTLTGNALMKGLRGLYQRRELRDFGWGYGPRPGECWNKVVRLSPAPRVRRSSPMRWPTRRKRCAAICRAGWPKNSEPRGLRVWTENWLPWSRRQGPRRTRRRSCRLWRSRMRKFTASTCWTWKTRCTRSGKRAFMPKRPWAAPGPWSNWRP